MPLPAFPAVAPLSRKGQPWTHAERHRLRKLRLAGHSYMECARILGRSRLTIERVVAESGLQVRGYHVWSVEEIRTLIRMRGEGATHAQIAAKVGHPISSVHAKWSAVQKRLAARMSATTPDPLAGEAPLRAGQGIFRGARA